MKCQPEICQPPRSPVVLHLPWRREGFSVGIMAFFNSNRSSSHSFLIPYHVLSNLYLFDSSCLLKNLRDGIHYCSIHFTDVGLSAGTERMSH